MFLQLSRGLPSDFVTLMSEWVTYIGASPPLTHFPKTESYCCHCQQAVLKCQQAVLKCQQAVLQCQQAVLKCRWVIRK